MESLTIAEVEEKIGIPIEKWPGNCYGISARINEAFNLGKLRYGHYHGEIHPDSLFADHRSISFCRHGWIEIEGGRVIDPTRWVFTCEEPNIYVGSGENYDSGGNIHRLTREPCPSGSGEIKLTVSSDCAAFLMDLTKKNSVNDFSVEQIFWLANSSLLILENFAKEIYVAICKVGYSAFIPLDNRKMVLDD